MKMKHVAALIFAVCLAACSQPTREIAPTLEAMGMTNVEARGLALWGCGGDKDNYWATKFTATGVNGAPVSGVVCKGAFKGQTVRF